MTTRLREWMPSVRASRARRQLGEAMGWLVAACGLAALIAQRPPAGAIGSWPHLLLFVLLFVASEFYVVRIHGARVSLHLPIALAALWRFDASTTVWIVAAGNFAAVSARRGPGRLPIVDTAVRTLQVTIAAAAARGLGAQLGTFGGAQALWQIDPLEPGNVVPVLAVAGLFLVTAVCVGEGLVAAILCLRVDDYAAQWRTHLPAQLNALGFETGFSLLLVLTDPLRSWLSTALFFIPIFAIGRLWQTSRALQHSTARLELLFQAAELLSVERTLPETCARLLRDLRKVFFFHAGGIATVDRDDESGERRILTLVAVLGIPESMAKKLRITLGNTLWEIIRGGKPRLIPDLCTFPKYNPDQVLGARCAILAPVSVENEVRALLVILHTLPGGFSQDDVKLLGAVANHVAVAIQNQERFEERTRLAVIEERNRFGRDVHDSAAQSLGGAILQLELLQRNLIGQPAADDLLPKISVSLRRCLSELRRAIHNLQPVAGGKCESFIAAIQKRLKMLGAEANIEVEWATFGRMCELPETVQSHLFHIANEAVANACRHSGAKRVRVELHFMAQRLRLFISDNGRGFDWARALAHARQHNRLGLASLNERAQLMGAQLVVETRPGFGTKIRVELPLRRAPEPEPIIVDRLS